MGLHFSGIRPVVSLKVIGIIYLIPNPPAVSKQTTEDLIGKLSPSFHFSFPNVCEAFSSKDFINFDLVNKAWSNKLSISVDRKKKFANNFVIPSVKKFRMFFKFKKNPWCHILVQGFICQGSICLIAQYLMNLRQIPPLIFRKKRYSYHCSVIWWNSISFWL